MDNVALSVKGNILTITIDLSKRGELNPKSGKTIRVASTLGNVKIPGTPVSLGLNAYVKP